MSSNNFSREVFLPLTNIFYLEELILDDNVQLGDLCPNDESTDSWLLWHMKYTLHKLSLRNTGAKFICSDWSSSPVLNVRQIDLSNNLITTLKYLDVTFTRTHDIKLDLSGNKVTQLLYDRKDYQHLISNRRHYCEPGGRFSSRASVELSSELQCDCHTQWGIRAMRDCPIHVHLLDLRCRFGMPISEVSLDDLVCAAPPDECTVPPPCRCDKRERLEEPSLVLRVTCEHSNLTALPILSAVPPVAWELQLAHNHIRAIHYSHLPSNLLELDLRHNDLSTLDLETVSSLLADERRVMLSSNPLVCDCSTASVIRALIMYQKSVIDFHDVKCLGNVPLFLPDCDINLSLILGLVTLMVVVVMLTSCVARPRWRRNLMVVLQGLGWWSRPAERPDNCLYDAFISFSHYDEELVQEMIERLENGSQPYRVCVHSRDWVPGGWIPHLISASVQRSRRTIAVVSENFLKSAWARAEFREAHAEAMRSAEPRLVVVLLADPESLTLDDGLRRYLKTNNYLRWGDPWFWQKLRAALPAPRAPSLSTQRSSERNAAALLAQQTHAFDDIDMASEQM
ncbi:protein toll-like [Anticarsia gemmatalis]|uniref:protein toll-like n=1 Tax=Anticarsia gemmatalis TaxID=129554 RepID=UPI003F766475